MLLDLVGPLSSACVCRATDIVVEQDGTGIIFETAVFQVTADAAMANVGIATVEGAKGHDEFADLVNTGILDDTVVLIGEEVAELANAGMAEDVRDVV